MGFSFANAAEKMMKSNIRIKTQTDKGMVHTMYHNDKWYSFAHLNSSLNVGARRKALEGSNLFEAGQNHLELCKELL